MKQFAAKKSKKKGERILKKCYFGVGATMS